MPYIKQERREQLNIYPEDVSTAGELNYAITMLCNGYMKEGHKSYQEINDIVGALECCKQEFYRRIAVKYEEQKMAENGDVYA